MCFLFFNFVYLCFLAGVSLFDHSDFGPVVSGKPDKHHLVLFFSFLCSGYLAPEYAMGGQLTMKADVYSFGVLILEIISGRSSSKPSWGGTQKLLLEWVRRFYFCNFQIYILQAFKIIFYIAIMITSMLEIHLS